MEIERDLSTIDIKNVAPAEIGTSQDGRVSAPGDLVGGEPTSLLNKKVDTAHEKGVAESLQANDNSDESSSETNVEEGDIKIAESKPLTSQDTSKIEHNTLLDSIVEIFEIKTKVMTSE